MAVTKTKEDPKKQNQKKDERDKSKAKGGPKPEKKKEGQKSGKKEGQKSGKKEGQKSGKKEGQKSGKKGGQKSGKKEEKEVKPGPGMSYMYDPCPHRVWTPKPGERDKSAPRGVGSPWYEPTRKKEDVDKEEAEKSKKKEEKSKAKRDKARQEKEKKREKEEKKKKEEEKKNKEKEKKNEELKKEKEKRKKKKENEKRKKQQEARDKEKERKKKEEEENKGKDKKKEKPKPMASYMFDPCPHRVYTPKPGEQDLGEPRGINSPWYVKPIRLEDIAKEDEEERKKDMEKRKKERQKRQKEKKEKERQEEEELRQAQEQHERKEKRRQKILEKRREAARERREKIEMEHEEMGAGVRDNRTDFTPEMIWMMDFISEVDNKEREKRGEALRWKKEELEEKIESDMAKEAFTKDFKKFVSTAVQAEWLKADKKLKKLESDERKRRREMLKTMDPLAKEMFEEGKRTETLYNAAVGRKNKGSGEEPSPMEEMMVNMIMKQMDQMDSSSLKSLFGSI